MNQWSVLYFKGVYSIWILSFPFKVYLIAVLKMQFFLYLNMYKSKDYLQIKRLLKCSKFCTSYEIQTAYIEHRLLKTSTANTYIQLLLILIEDRHLNLFDQSEIWMHLNEMSWISHLSFSTHKKCCYLKRIKKILMHATSFCRTIT